MVRKNENYIKLFESAEGYVIEYPNGYRLDVSVEELQVLLRAWRK